MLAQRKYQVATPVVRKPRRQQKKLLHGLMKNRMLCALMFAVAVTFVLSVYVSAYARATKSGYEKAALLSHLKSVKIENESMRLTLESLQQPERIEAFAVENGMEQAGSRIAYIKPDGQPSVAQNLDDQDIR